MSDAGLFRPLRLITFLINTLSGVLFAARCHHSFTGSQAPTSSRSFSIYFHHLRGIILKEIKARGATLVVILVGGMTLAALLALVSWKQLGRSGYARYGSSSAAVEAGEFNSWKQAALRVSEERGEPVGKQAKVDVPPQLRHYSDTRRFLAVQVAEWREQRFETPQDFADLAGLIEKGEMVELKPVTEDYILYGVGGSADEDSFTYFDQNTGRRVALYGEAELAQEYARIAEARTSLENEIADLRVQLKVAARATRAKIQAQMSEKQKALKAEAERKESLDDYYGDAEKRRQLLADYDRLAKLASDFRGQTYDINEARSRKEMKVRMLSSLRPAAVRMLEEIAASYRRKFDRPLPITSLVRPDEYQHALSKVNPNAVRIETPPHSTGLAFDIFYRYMTADEQSFVMAELARLKDEGRIEVLRENRDHYHVFTFINGKRPSEDLITESLGKGSGAKTSKATPAKETVAKKDDRKEARKETRKEARRETPKREKKAKGRRR